MAISTVDALEALRVLNRTIAREPDVVPEGFQTSKEWAKQWGIGASTANHKLKAGVDAGLFEVRKLRIHEANNPTRTNPVPHYRFLVSRNGKGKAK